MAARVAEVNAPPSQYPEASADERRFPQDFPAEVLALADAVIDRTRGERGITVRRAVAELIVALQTLPSPLPRAAGGTTAKQQEAYAFICGYVREHAYSPSYDEIRAAVGIASKSGVFRLLGGLEERGLIERLPNRARSIQIAGRG